MVTTNAPRGSLRLGLFFGMLVMSLSILVGGRYSAAGEAAGANNRGTETVINSATFPRLNKDKQPEEGAWADFAPEAYENSYFTFGGGWWNEGWSWMHIRSNNPAPVEFTFTGNAFELHHLAYPGGDSYQIFLDGELKATVSNIAEEEGAKLAWRWEDPNNEDKQHKVRIVCVEPGAHEKHVRLDSFRYWRH